MLSALTDKEIESRNTFRLSRLYADADRLPKQVIVERLNRYFDCIVLPLEARGGQVLKFMGDGLLATFVLKPEAERTLLVVSVAALSATSFRHRKDN